MRAFVASDDASLSYQLRESLAQLGHECPASHVASLSTAVRRLASLPGEGGSTEATAPDLIFVNLSPDPEGALGAVRELRRTGAFVIAIGPATDPKFLLRTIREGAQEYLDEANLNVELKATLKRIEQERASRRDEGRLVAVLSASGGSGCSTLALNIAVSLAKKSQSCVLLDLDAEAGDLAPLLDLRPTYSLADLCRGGARLDRGLLEGALVAHESGVRLLAAPSRLADVEFVTEDGVRRVVALAKDLASFVVADLGRNYRTDSLRLLSQAHVILLVMRLDFTSLRNARRLTDFMHELGIGAERLHLVVNRHRQTGELPVAQAESALGLKAAKFVVDDPKLVMRANNNGVPVVMEAPTAKVSTHIGDVAEFVRANAP